MKILAAIFGLAIVAPLVHAEGGTQIDPKTKQAKIDGPLAADRFELPTDAAPGRIGSRYLRIAQDLFCASVGTMRVVLFDVSIAHRIDTTVRCPTQADWEQLRLVRYAPDIHRIGWFYTLRTDRNPYPIATEQQQHLDYEFYDKSFEGYYVEQDLQTGKLDPPIRLFQATGYGDLYEAPKVSLAIDDRTLDVGFHEERRNHRPMSSIVRLDLETRAVKPVVAIAAATPLKVFWSASHRWAALTGWLDKFDTEYDPGTAIFIAPESGIRFQVSSASSVFDVVFDENHQDAYVGSAPTGDVWRVDLAKQRIDRKRGGFGLVNSLLLSPDKRQLAVLPSYPEYIATGRALDHPIRHDYKPLLGTDVPYPWAYAMTTSADGRYTIYTFGEQAAVLTWR